MRWRLLPAVAGALSLSLAASACVSKSEMDTFVNTGYTTTENGTTVTYLGLRPYLEKVRVAVCQLESKEPSGSLDESKRMCPTQGEQATPPKYPPK